MAQQIFDKGWPLAKNGANELIPGAAILQTRDGKDEPITLAASFQIGESGLFLPTSKDNPLEVRVRQLEAELQQLRQLLQNGDAQVTLTAQEPETIHSRAVRTSTVTANVTPPPGARGAIVSMVIYEATGTFGSNQGARLDVHSRLSTPLSNPVATKSNLIVETDWTTEHRYYHSIVWAQGIDLTGASDALGELRWVSAPLPSLLRVRISVEGTFNQGEGIDCEAVVQWTL